MHYHVPFSTLFIAPSARNDFFNTIISSCLQKSQGSYREGCKVNFKDLLLRAKDGDQQAKEEIFLMYRPLLFKESCVNGIFDEDLFQELSATLIHCIRMFKL